MRKAIFIVAIIVGIGIVAAAQGTVSVGVEETYASEWEQFATDLEAQSGVTLGIQPYSDTYLQLWLRFSRFQLSMIQEGWVSIYSRYLEDLSEIENQLTASGVELVYHGNKPVAVPISFAPGWLLAVRAWPARGTQDVAAVLSAVAAGTAAPDRVVSTGIGQTYGAAKMARAEHNPHVDGALTALVQAVESTVGTMSAANLADLPSVARNTVSAVANAFGVPLSTEESTVTVVMEASFGNAVNASLAALSALGISDVDVAAASNLIRASVPLPLLEAVLGQLSGTVYIRPPYVPHELDIDGEGVAAIGAAAFHAQGITGSGTKIAVIDLGFSGLSQSQASGDLPYGAFTYDASGTGIASGVSHGTAVAEVVHETAPDAQLYLIKIGDEVDLDQAVTYCINNGIDIINHSLGWYNTNFYDGTGPIAEIAQRAVDGGILWVNSAGNEAQRHWEGSFADANTDGKLDTSISLQAQAGQRVVLYLTWNEWPASSTDYDLYVYDPLENVIAASTKYQTGTEEPTESVQFQANMNGTYRIEVAGSGSERMELFSLFQGLSPVVASSSLIAPANVADVVTVGAISFSPYSGTVQIQPYSSRGPTNDGRSKPDLVGPDSVSTSVSGYAPFLGTSCASPHVAGAAALLLSDEPSLTVSQLRAEVVSQVVPVGDANIFGAGRLLLSLAPANQPPVASFTVSPSSPVTGQAASFNGLGSYDVDGTISQYSWQFGDGTTGAGTTTSHAYSSAGTYTARLTVIDDDGATHSATRSVIVQPSPNQPPTASFTFSPTSPTTGQNVSFNGASSFDPDGSIVQYSWQFGDGATDSGATTSHSYSSAGTYTARLTVIDDDGATHSTTRLVTVQPSPNQPPTASFTFSPTSPATGQNVSFNGTSSFDPDGSIAQYSWQFGDGATDSGATTSHSYASAGTYTARLTVTDDDGATHSTTRSVTVAAPQLPDLVISDITHSPATPQIGASVGFQITIRNQGTVSAGLFRVRIQGASSAASTYVWQLSAGNSTTVSLSRTLTQSSETFTVRLDDLSQIEESNESNNTATHTVTAGVPAPVADAGGPYSGTTGQPVSFSAAGSTGTISSYTWSFGDGATGFGITPTHSYASATTYTVTLTVSGPGGQDTDTAQVQISPAVLPPVASAGGPYSGTVGQPVSFSAAGSVGSISSYTWSFGDGATGFGATPTHSYAAAITYTVTLTVSGPGGQDTDTAQVQISPAVLPPVANAGGPYSGTVGQPVSFSAAGSTGTISSYTWSFGDGATGFGATPTHSYAAATTYTVTLTVAGPGGQDTDVTQVQVSPAAPALSLELSLPKSSYQLDEPLTLFYTLNRTAYVYICEADSSGRVSLLFPNYREPNPRVTVGNRQLPGVPGYTLTVSEPTGTDTIYAFAATSPIPSFPTSFSSSFPVLSYNPIGFRDSVLSSLQSQFTFGDWAYDTVTFTIEEPAPTTGTLQITSSPSGATVIIDGNTVGTTPGSATLSAGIHTVQLTRAGYVPETRTVQITAGQSSSLNVILTPETVNQPPNAAFTVSPSSPSVNQVVSFNAGSSTDPDGTILSYSWSFGDGATGTGMQPTHVYTGGGTFTVQLTVTDNQGASDSTTRSVSVSIPSFSEPRAFWQFNEGSGSTAFDASANANHGTLQGATWDTNDADGTFAVRLDGSNDSVSVPHAPSLSLFEEFTFEAWVRYDTVPTADAPILRKPDAYRLVLKQSQLKLILVINGSTRTVTASIPTIAVDRWYQVAATYDGSRVRLYLNGQEVAEQAISGAINQTTSPVSIGRADSDVIDGMIDNVRIFGRALAPSEFNLLPAGTTPENQPPVADFTWSPGTPSVNEFVRFRSNSSDPEDGTNVSVRWTFGNGGIGGGGSPRIRYTQARQYTVTITVTDSEGLETSLSKVITVVP